MTLLQCKGFMVHDRWGSWPRFCRGPCEKNAGGPCMILYSFLSKRSLHDHAQVTILWRSWQDPLYEVLAWRSCRCLLWEALGRFLSQDLVRSSPAAAGPGMKILVKVFYNFLVRRSCGDPSEMLSEACAWSCTGPCEKLLKRSWWNPLGVLEWPRTGPWEDLLESWNPPQEVLGLRSWRCSALVLVWKFVWDAHRKFLYEDLARSSI